MSLFVMLQVVSYPSRFFTTTRVKDNSKPLYLLIVLCSLHLLFINLKCGGDFLQSLAACVVACL